MTNNSGGFQFSIAGLLVLMVMVGIAASVLYVLPDDLAAAAIIFLFIAVPSLLTTRIIYGSGYQRTFCIGALFPTGVGIYGVGWFLGLGLLEQQFDSPENIIQSLNDHAMALRVAAGGIWISAVIIGLLSVLSRWAMDRGTTRP